MSKTVTPFIASLVQFNTTLPFAEVIARLDVEVNKVASGGAKIRLVKNQQELESLVEETVGTDFLYFTEFSHHKLLKLADGIDRPGIVVYTIGNPLFGQPIMRCNPLAAFNIPPRLLVIDKPDGTGTTVSYHLPSSVMGVLVGENEPLLQVELKALDEKIEKLARKITSV